MSALSIRNMNRTIGERELESTNTLTAEERQKIHDDVYMRCTKLQAQWIAEQHPKVDVDAFLAVMDTIRSAPMTGEQADIARWQDETEATRRSDYPI